MRKHVIKCWGQEALDAAGELRNAKAAREPVAALGRSGSLPAAFAKQGGRSNITTYSTRQHTRAQIR